MLKYAVRLTRDTNGTILVDFRDVPEAHTFGHDREDALGRAPDALETVLMGYIEDRRPIPKASSTKRGDFVTLPALTEAKLAVYSTMRAAGIGKAELARRLNWHLPQVDRLLDLRHASRLDQIEAALRVLGKQLSLQISSGEPGRKKRPAAARERARIAAGMRRHWRTTRRRRPQPA